MGQAETRARCIHAIRKRHRSSPSAFKKKKNKGNGWLSNTIANPLDTTIALHHLTFEGTLRSLPRS